MSNFEQYLLKDKLGYYWIWYRVLGEKPQLNGPHSSPMINLPVIENVDNPLSWQPPQEVPNDRR